MNLQEIIDSWKIKLKKMQDDPHMPRMDERTSLGVQHGVIVTLKQCIKELEAAKENNHV